MQWLSAFPTFSEFALFLLVGSFSYSDLYIKAICFVFFLVSKYYAYILYNLYNRHDLTNWVVN